MNPTPKTAGQPPSSSALRILQAGVGIGSWVLGLYTHIYILGCGFIYIHEYVHICIHIYSYIYISICEPKPQTSIAHSKSQDDHPAAALYVSFKRVPKPVKFQPPHPRSYLYLYIYIQIIYIRLYLYIYEYPKPFTI